MKYVSKSVRGRAATLCSMAACNLAGVFWCGGQTRASDSAIDLAHAAYMASFAQTYREHWAEAEAMLRCGWQPRAAR